MCVLEQQLACTESCKACAAGDQAAGCCLLLLCAPPHRLKLESCRPILCCLAELCRHPALAACQHGVQLQPRISSTTHPEPGQHRQGMRATGFLHRGHSRVQYNFLEARGPTQDSAGSCLLATREGSQSSLEQSLLLCTLLLKILDHSDPLLAPHLAPRQHTGSNNVTRHAHWCPAPAAAAALC